MSKKAKVKVKDPDALYYAQLSEEEQNDISENYSEFSEYFMVEIDFKTKKARLLPLDEWYLTCN